MKPRDLNTPWAELLIDRLVAAGVTHGVVSPGARSTPLTLAAARHPGLRLELSIDERAAAFFALGQVRLTGRPSLLICTSGSAPGHYLPALIEASQSGLPLLVLTADRPPELHHRAAPQTVDQVKLFGEFVRRYFELGLPDDDPRALAGLASTAALAVTTSLAPQAGPVHLNAWFRKPLEPQLALAPEDEIYRAEVEKVGRRALTRRFPPRREPQPEAVRELVERIRGTQRGLLIAGPGPLGQRALRPLVQRLAQLSGFPLLAEAPSQLRFTGTSAGWSGKVDLFEPLLRAPSWLNEAPPEWILQIGAPPTSTGIERLLEQRPEIERWVLAAHGWNDPYNQAEAVVAGALPLTVAALIEELEKTASGGGPTDWSNRWTAAESIVRQVLAERPRKTGALPESVEILPALLHGVPGGTLVLLSNSLPVREIDLFAAGDINDLDILAQKGANGIEGMIAGAAGTASVAERPVLLLLGDVAAQHDLSSLALCRPGRAPLVIAILNNGGGRIFDLLPLGRTQPPSEPFQRFFRTAPEVAFGTAAAAFGLGHARVESVSDLPSALEQALTAPGGFLVELAVDGEGTRGLHQGFFAEIAQRLVP